MDLSEEEYWKLFHFVKDSIDSGDKTWLDITDDGKVKDKLQSLKSEEDQKLIEQAAAIDAELVKRGLK